MNLVVKMVKGNVLVLKALAAPWNHDSWRKRNSRIVELYPQYSKMWFLKNPFIYLQYLQRDDDTIPCVHFPIVTYKRQPHEETGGVYA